MLVCLSVEKLHGIALRSVSLKADPEVVIQVKATHQEVFLGKTRRGLGCGLLSSKVQY